MKPVSIEASKQLYLLISKMNSFRDFFFKFLKTYKIFGITPYTNRNSSVTLSFLALSLIALSVILCWIGVFVTFSRDVKTDGLVTVANSIQFICKYLTLTLVLTYPLTRKNLMNSIINSFESIDKELSHLQVLPQYNYDKAVKINNISSIICFLYLVIISIYDFVIVFYTSKDLDFMLYWIIVNIPIVTITFAMLQACAVTYLIKERCHIINRVIGEIYNSKEQPSRHEVFLCIGNVLNSRELFEKIMFVLTELGTVSRLAQQFYGPIFFTAFVTSFAVVCIQMFYCYIVLVTETLAKGYNFWTMISSINQIITNLFLVVSITTLCESVTSEVSEKIVDLKLLIYKNCRQKKLMII